MRGRYRLRVPEPILTHDRFHGGEDDTLPVSLSLPLDVTGVEPSP